MSIKKYLALLTIVGGCGIGIGYFGYKPIKACACDYQQSTPTPIVTEEVTPTPTEEITPTPTIDQDVTPTPTPISECGDCVTPTPEATPGVTPTPGQSDNAPVPQVPMPPVFVCQDGTTVNLPANPHMYRNGEEATVKWVPTQGDLVNIYWRVLGHSTWENALGDQANNGYVVIHDLKVGVAYEFAIQQHVGCGGGPVVVVVDSPASSLFTQTYITYL